MQRVEGFVQQGGQQISTSGLQGAPDVQASYPLATVTVYLTGTTTLASIYSDNGVTPLANPFTASAVGFWFFYAANGRYDVKFSGGGLPAPWTLGDILLQDGAGSTSVTSVTAADASVVVTPNTGAVTIRDAWGVPPSGSQTQLLQIKPNTGNNTTYQWTSRSRAVSSDYDFPALSPGGSLTSGITNTVTLIPVPLGVNGTDTNHYLYISGGTGTAEPVLITGGTAVSGAASGTVTFTPANNHSGAWTVRSATAGIQEAIYAPGTLQVAVYIPAGTWNIYGKITVPTGYPVSIRGAGMYNTIVQTNGSLAGDWLVYAVNTGGLGGGIDLGDFTIQDATATYHTSGNMVRIKTRGFGSVSNLQILFSYNGLNVENNIGVTYDDIYVTCSNYGVYINTNGISGGSGGQSSGSFTNVLVETNGNNANAWRIEGQTVGITFTGCGCGAAVNAGTNYSLVIAQTSLGPCNELQFSNCVFDGHGNSVLITGYGTYANNYILFDNCEFASTDVGVMITNSINGVSFCNCTFNVSGGDAFDLGTCRNCRVTSSRVNCTGAAFNLVGGATISSLLILGNTVGFESAPGVAIGLSATMTDVLFIGNQFAYTSLVTLVTSSGWLFLNNFGIDNVFTTLASATSLALSIYNQYYVSGTTAITTLTNSSQAGRQITLIKTDTGTLTVGGGGNIPAAHSMTQNSALRLTFDGTNWY